MVSSSEEPPAGPAQADLVTLPPSTASFSVVKVERAYSLESAETEAQYEGTRSVEVDFWCSLEDDYFCLCLD
jgi:hypothetical protein